MSSKSEFEMDVHQFHKGVEWFLEKWFGERCPDFEPNCTNCQRWAALDTLIDNPFKDDKE